MFPGGKDELHEQGITDLGGMLTINQPEAEGTNTRQNNEPTQDAPEQREKPGGRGEGSDTVPDKQRRATGAHLGNYPDCRIDNTRRKEHSPSPPQPVD